MNGNLVPDVGERWTFDSREQLLRGSIEVDLGLPHAGPVNVEVPPFPGGVQAPKEALERAEALVEILHSIALVLRPIEELPTPAVELVMKMAGTSVHRGGELHRRQRVQLFIALACLPDARRSPLQRWGYQQTGAPDAPWPGDAFGMRTSANTGVVHGSVDDDRGELWLAPQVAKTEWRSLARLLDLALTEPDVIAHQSEEHLCHSLFRYMASGPKHAEPWLEVRPTLRSATVEVFGNLTTPVGLVGKKTSQVMLPEQVKSVIDPRKLCPALSQAGAGHCCVCPADAFS